MDTGAKGKTYKIGQAAKLLDVKPFVLRFWETEFKDALVPVRTPAGQRAYTEQNVATVREIKRLLYDEGLTIEGAKKRLGQCPAPATSPVAPASAPSAWPGPLPLDVSLSPGVVTFPSKSESPAAQDDTWTAARADDASAAQRDALRATLREVEGELLSIRDLLAAPGPKG